MGLPDLPEQNDEDDTFCIREDNIINVEITSDESEYESGEENGHIGYQPLSLQEFNESTMDIDDDDDADEDTEPEELSSPHSAYISSAHHPNSDFLNVDVWNAPRPEELNIELDGAKSNQILNVMAAIQLPNLSVPDWAKGIPEDKWKEDLLLRIRQHSFPREAQKPDA
ncbi:uncharacterized protein LOC131681205 [Topomyia yanbarensis]|uniref:uncharacterized protein LOC131681205 n=1 Tax=Topomyia yanbarensis TaxID=2498891 RepID=UPI00273CD0E8|nr:uncharacterized protein LOC131681205 [Topomyia yanbarensis]